MDKKTTRRLLFVIALFLIGLFGIPMLVSVVAPRATPPMDETVLIVDAPPAPVLTASGDQTLYQIDPTRSQARYVVQEVFLNAVEGRTVTGVTQAIRGDMLIDLQTPRNSRIGEIVVNVQALQSDSALRDQRLRADYLESDEYPEVRFVAEGLVGLPDVVAPDNEQTLQLNGYLTVRDITTRVVWDLQWTFKDGEIRGNAVTTIRMSTFGVGPINLIGWLQTEDELRLELDFVAVPSEETIVAEAVEAATIPMKAAVYTGSGIEFNKDVRPILEQRCVACHTTGQIGFAIFALSTVQDAVNFAQELAMVAEARYMPPWFASDEMPPLLHDPSLTEDEIATLVEWARVGAPVEGNTEEALVAKPSTGVTIEQDLVLPMPVVYVPPTGRTDDYRCFLLDPQLDTTRYITGSEVIPGNISTVHHVLVFPVPSEARAAANAKENTDGRPGWECFGGTGLTGFDTNTAIAPGWVPGGGANQFPDGTGILLQPGDLFVFQVHYKLEAGNLPDQSTLILDLSEPDEELIALQGIGLFAPVELPCPVAYRQTEPCQRDHAIQDAEELDESAGLFADALLVICNRTLADYENQDAANIVSTCDSEAPIGGQAIQVNGHMHRLGTTNRIELNPDTDQAQVLLDIPNWDFDWQQNYTFVEPIQINKGDILRITCSWDNSRPIQTTSTATTQTSQTFLDSLTGVGRTLAHETGRTTPYKYVTWGEGTRDEMCLSAVVVIPDAEYLDVRLTDSGQVDDNSIMLAILWMRLERSPLLMAGLALGVVLVLVAIVWAGRQVMIRLRRV